MPHFVELPLNPLIHKKRQKLYIYNFRLIISMQSTLVRTAIVSYSNEFTIVFSYPILKRIGPHISVRHSYSSYLYLNPQILNHSIYYFTTIILFSQQIPEKILHLYLKDKIVENLCNRKELQYV